MNHTVLICLIVVIGLFAISPLYLLIVNGPAFRQKRDQVVIREAGKHFLGKPQDAFPEAHMDVDFAILSEAAYQRTAYAKKPKSLTTFNPDTILNSIGWYRWEHFPTGDVKDRVDNVHLRVEVWSNASKKKVAVAFGGTVARSIKDWLSDFRWFLPERNDEYTEINRDFGKDFCSEYRRRGKDAGFEFLAEASLFSTGHSLGGGLAQQFAYSLPTNCDVPRVKKVFAFDPSPVTGFYSVQKTLRDENKQGLDIDRIFQRGEILAIFRSLLNVFYAPSAKNPTIRQIRYNLFHSFNPIADHSMTKFAFEMWNLCKRNKDAQFRPAA